MRRTLLVGLLGLILLTALANVVSYEASVRATLAKVTLGEADAAIVYASDVTGPTVEKVQRIDLPESLTTIAKFYKKSYVS